MTENDLVFLNIISESVVANVDVFCFHMINHSAVCNVNHCRAISKYQNRCGGDVEFLKELNSCNRFV